MPVQITAKKDGFRRAGVAHPAVMTEYADGTFTDEQLAQLKAEPMLTVKVIKATKKDNGSKDAAAAKQTTEAKAEPVTETVIAEPEAASTDAPVDSGA